MLPSSITLIEEGAFSGCTALTEIIFASDLTTGITLQTNAFKNCTALKSITFPSNITVWGNGAFAECTSLVDIYMSDTDPSTIDNLDGAIPFDDNGGKIKIYVNKTVFNTYTSRWTAYVGYFIEVTNDK